MIEYPSPNFNERKNITKIDMLIIHYTDMMSAKPALQHMCNEKSQVSAHYLICEKGIIYRLVNEKYRAWHAGVSHWRGITDINSHSIGIELDNPGHTNGLRPFPNQQMQSLINLCHDILTRHKIPSYNIIGHSDIAAGRKLDPGPLFDWQLLAQNNIGLWPKLVGPKLVGPKLKINGNMEKSDKDNKHILMQILSNIGYDAKNTQAIAAFQRHYMTDNINNIADDKTIALAKNLLAAIAKI